MAVRKLSKKSSALVIAFILGAYLLVTSILSFIANNYIEHIYNTAITQTSNEFQVVLKSRAVKNFKRELTFTLKHPQLDMPITTTISASANIVELLKLNIAIIDIEFEQNNTNILQATAKIKLYDQINWHVAFENLRLFLNFELEVNANNGTIDMISNKALNKFKLNTNIPYISIEMDNWRLHTAGVNLNYEYKDQNSTLVFNNQALGYRKNFYDLNMQGMMLDISFNQNNNLLNTEGKLTINNTQVGDTSFNENNINFNLQELNLTAINKENNFGAILLNLYNKNNCKSFFINSNKQYLESLLTYFGYQILLDTKSALTFDTSNTILNIKNGISLLQEQLINAGVLKQDNEQVTLVSHNNNELDNSSKK